MKSMVDKFEFPSHILENLQSRLWREVLSKISNEDIREVMRDIDGDGSGGYMVLVRFLDQDQGIKFKTHLRDLRKILQMDNDFGY